MKPEEIKSMMPVIQAFAEGKPIEHKGIYGWKASTDLSFCDGPENYRIKSEPKKIWAVVCNETGGIFHSNSDENIVREYYSEYWQDSSDIYTYSLEEYIQVV